MGERPAAVVCLPRASRTRFGATGCENGPVEKLAELYVQQGVLSEARPIYLQLAEMHRRARRLEAGCVARRRLARRGLGRPGSLARLAAEPCGGA